MPNTFDWDNAEEIGIQLAEKHPGVDPLTVRFTDMHEMDHRASGIYRRSEDYRMKGSWKRSRWRGTRNFKTTSKRFSSHAANPRTFVRTFTRSSAQSFSPTLVSNSAVVQIVHRIACEVSCIQSGKLRWRDTFLSSN